jgi:hypothetical protein
MLNYLFSLNKEERNFLQIILNLKIKINFINILKFFINY